MSACSPVQRKLRSEEFLIRPFHIWFESPELRGSSVKDRLLIYLSYWGLDTGPVLDLLLWPPDFLQAGQGHLGYILLLSMEAILYKTSWLQVLVNLPASVQHAG